jgi:hypothetical protein
MCTGFEPLLMGAGEAGLADAIGLGVGDFIGSGAAELGMGAGASLGMGATDMSLGAAGAGNAASYLSQLGGLDSVLGSQFAGDIAPFTQSATDVASITNNAVPGLENNIGDLGNFDGIPPQAPEPIPGLSQGSNFEGIKTLSNPELADVMKGVNPNFTNSLAPDSSISQNFQNGNFRTTIPGEIGDLSATDSSLGQAGLQNQIANQTANPFSLSNLMSNPMGAVKSAYDTVSKNPIPSMYAAGSLYDMYAKNKMAKAQENMYNQNRADIMNTYAPGSPEYNLLAQQMARKDAAAGRNSQYGTRANDLAGTIAKLRMGALGNLQSGQNQLGNQMLGNQYGMFNTPLALAMYSQKPNAATTPSY